jgi:hypothetical protein
MELEKRFPQKRILITGAKYVRERAGAVRRGNIVWTLGSPEVYRYRMAGASPSRPR